MTDKKATRQLLQQRRARLSTWLDGDPILAEDEEWQRGTEGAGLVMALFFGGMLLWSAVMW